MHVIMCITCHDDEYVNMSMRRVWNVLQHDAAGKIDGIAETGRGLPHPAYQPG